MDYDVVATLGPGSRDPATWAAMAAAGASAFRLNTSHLSIDETRIWLEQLDAFFASHGQALPVVLDLQGGKWRLGNFPACDLLPGQIVTLLPAPEASAAGVLPVPHADFFTATQDCPGQMVLNDARIHLDLLDRSAVRARARVVVGGRISPHKGITLPGSGFRIEALSDKDQALAALARAYPFTRIAVSYVKDDLEMAHYRRLLGDPAGLIAKLERAPALAAATGIARQCSQVWLCRGDLGAELGLAEMARAAQRFAAGLPLPGAPALLAGQVLEHLTCAPEPTRAEVCALYTALTGGYQGVVLSDETAIGPYPVESCRAAALFRTAALDGA
ncbi:MAG: hypothetical protein GYA17_21195 [Chloroflexi bacterium]|nr:hypothetical protein [Chloroflexota bacterium]